jgi:hypothetical protein
MTVAGAGGALEWVVRVLGVASSPFRALSYAAPRVLGVQGSGDPGGFVAVVACVNCAQGGAGAALALFDGSVLTAEVSGAFELTVVIPPGAGGDHTLVVVVRDIASAPVRVSYANPVMIAVDVVAAGPGGTMLLNAVGASFAGALSVTLSGVPCRIASFSRESVTFWVAVSGRTVNRTVL